jgi:putative ABC transport system permease protein
MLAKSPGFTVAAILTLALGIGANSTVFSMVSTLLLRPLPVKNPGQIQDLFPQQKDDNTPLVQFSIPNFRDIRSQSAGAYSDVIAHTYGIDGFAVNGKSDRVVTEYVSGNFFSMLGLKPALGRLLLPSEGETLMADPVIVLSYSYWNTRFGRDTRVLGKQVSVDGHPMTVVGVAPEGFTGLNPFVSIQGYMPLAMMPIGGYPADLVSNRQSRTVFVMARLAEGMTPQKAQAELDVIGRRLSEQYPSENKNLSIQAFPEVRGRIGPDPKNRTLVASVLFQGLAILVLLLACANVANLLLVRATIREREMAIRAALGAERSRLISQLLTESVMLALGGGLGGLILGKIGALSIGSIPLGIDIATQPRFGFDWRVFTFGIAAALVTGIVVGIVPAVRASRGNLAQILHEGGRTVAGGKQRLRNVLVAIEVSASLMLLIVAGLFTRSLKATERVNDLGFDTDHIVNLSMDPNEIGYNAGQTRQFYKSLLNRVRELPGVESASIASSVPMGLYGNQDSILIEGYEPPPGKPVPFMTYNAISQDFLNTMGIPLLRGRTFTERDDENSAYVAIVSEGMAKEYWPNQDPIGHHLRLGADASHSIEVVGIAKNARFQGLTGPIQPYLLVPVWQHMATNTLETLQIRTIAAPETMIPAAERVLGDIAPELPVFDVKTMKEGLNTLAGLLFYKIGAVLAAVFGVLGLVLAIVGVYGVISYAASQKTHEIGIRMALGAQPEDILKLILRQGLVIVAVGLALGVIAALAVARVVGNFLTVSPMDPVTYLTVSALLTIVALLACYIPAQRAMRVDPMVALRYE